MTLAEFLDPFSRLFGFGRGSGRREDEGARPQNPARFGEGEWWEPLNELGQEGCILAAWLDTSVAVGHDRLDCNWAEDFLVTTETSNEGGFPERSLVIEQDDVSRQLMKLWPSPMRNDSRFWSHGLLR